MEREEIERIARIAGKEAGKKVFTDQMRILGVDMKDQHQINEWHDTWAWADRGRKASQSMGPWARKALISAIATTVIGGVVWVGYKIAMIIASLHVVPR